MKTLDYIARACLFPSKAVSQTDKSTNTLTPPLLKGNLLVATEHRFIRTPDGLIWSEGSGHYATWRRLLPEPTGVAPFETVTIAARVAEATSLPSTAKPVEGLGLRVAPLTSYVGPLGYIGAMRNMRKEFQALVSSGRYDTYLARQPGIISGQLVKVLRQAGLPWMCEVVGDPHEMFTSASTHPLRSVFRHKLTKLQNVIAQEALGVMYVSQSLADAYPAGKLSIVASDVELAKESFRPPPLTRVPGPFRLTLIGTLEQPYKGIDTAITVLAKLREEGRDVTLSIIGGGRLQSSFMAQAESLRISSHITWMGWVPAGEAVRKAISTSDLYIQPSITEGMPRALLEACAWGLPALATPVGGIPEILSPDQLVPVGDVKGWVAAIGQLQDNPTLLASIAERSYSAVKKWHVDAMNAARHRLFEKALQERGG